jgi:hypothetical protein
MGKTRQTDKGKAPGKDDRNQRLKAALKANIARRKAQARARKGTGPAETDGQD